MSESVQNILLVVLCVLALGILFEVIRIAVHLSIAKRMTRMISKFERLDPAASTRILFVGDSTGYGTGTSHSRYSIVGRLGADFPEAHIENQSGSGGFLSKARTLLQTRAGARDHAPFDLIIIMMGGMDLVHGTPLRYVRRSLQSALVSSKQCGRATLLVSPNNTGLAPLYRFPVATFFRWRAKQFDALYQDLAREEDIHFVSLFQEREDPLVLQQFFAPDKTHPSDDGYGLWYEQMKETIAAALHTHE